MPRRVIIETHTGRPVIRVVGNGPFSRNIQLTVNAGPMAGALFEDRPDRSGYFWAGALARWSDGGPITATSGLLYSPGDSAYGEISGKRYSRLSLGRTYGVFTYVVDDHRIGVLGGACPARVVLLGFTVTPEHELIVRRPRAMSLTGEHLDPDARVVNLVPWQRGLVGCRVVTRSGAEIVVPSYTFEPDRPQE